MNFQERREAQRKWSREGGLVIIPGVRDVYSCHLRDLSSKGAGLQLYGLALLPTDFIISFDGLLHVFECRLIWRRRDFVGLRFDW
jgi:PilZ domain-containing protein